jgi:ketosteroid isomerase-like protein
MSRENVEVVRRAWEAFVRRDDGAAFALYDPEITIHHQVDGSVYRGLAGARAFVGDWLASWTDYSTDLEELIDAGDDVIAVMRIRAQGRRSAVPVERREWHVWTVRDGRLWRFRIYATEAEALEAVGMSE